MKIHNIDATGSFTYNGVDLSNLTGSTTDSGSFSIQINNLNQSSSSLNSFTSSINTTIKSKLDSESVISGSVQVLITGTTGYSTFSSSISSSIGSLSGSVATTTSNLSSSIGSLSSSVATTTSNLSSSIGSLSSSVATTTLNLSSSVATTTSNLSSSIGSLSSSVATTTSGLSSRIGSIETKTGSYATTGSNIFVGSQTITGSLYITTDLVVQGCSCLQNITASAVSIGTNVVMLNTATPAVRFAGISVQDSGSNAGVTGSIFWDGLCNKWIYSNPSNVGYSGGMLLSGPRNTSGTIGNESPLTCNVIAKSGGGDHIYDSSIIDDGTTVCINANLIGTGTACFGGTATIGNTLNVTSGNIKTSAGYGLAWSGDETRIITPEDNVEGGLFKVGPTSATRFLRGSCTSIRIDGNSITNFTCQICTPSIDIMPSGIGVNTLSGLIRVVTTGTSTGIAVGQCNTNRYTHFAANDIQVFNDDFFLSTRCSFPLSIGTCYTARLTFAATGIACFACQVCTPAAIITGCVTIGSTTAPGSTLDITRSSPDPFNTVQCQLSLINGAGNGGAGTQLNFNNGGAIPYIRGLVDGANSTSGAGLVFGTANSATAGTERMRISNTGCVGIGATSPQATLHICTINTTASLRMESACDQAGLRLIAGVSGTARATRIDFLNGATCVGRPQWTIINDYNQNGTNDLRFVSCDPATSLLSIGQNGGFCINGWATISTGCRAFGRGLTVFSDVVSYYSDAENITMGISAGTGAQSWGIQVCDTGDGGSALHLNARGGNVGINKGSGNSASYPLDVTGVIRATGNIIGGSSNISTSTICTIASTTLSSSRGIVVDVNTTTNNAFVPVGFSWASSVSNYNPTWGMAFKAINYNAGTADLAFYTAGSVKMTVTDGGNVGIATTNPGARLDVSGTVKISDSGRLYINQFLPLGIVYRNDELADGDGSSTTVGNSDATNGNAKRRLATAPGGTMWYGPYTTIPAGTYIAHFRLKVADNSSGAQILTIDVTNVVSAGGVAIRPNAFAASNRYQYFKIPFTVTDPTSVIEFRGLSFVGGVTDIYLDHVMILPGS